MLFFMYVPSGERGDVIKDVICSSFFGMENMIAEDAYNKKRKEFKYKFNQSLWNKLKW